ncbi:hypothetical protein ACHAC9_18285 [Massilia sp. CMS3.1]|uniref:hypothetical protein n=1 Tax=Massilia sp. CMS3.1 TaxID=3373083 RepID=UPI003EE706D7
MHFRTSPLATLGAALFVTLLSGCSTVAEKTNFLSDADIKSKVAGTLGHASDAITLIDRRTEGTNTYVTVRVKAGKEFACTLNGGNLLSAGIVNPPTCTPRA